MNTLGSDGDSRTAAVPAGWPRPGFDQPRPSWRGLRSSRATISF